MCKVKSRVWGHNEPEKKIEVFYIECDDWYREDIQTLIGIKNMVNRNLN